jgi:hypothetical protein
MSSCSYSFFGVTLLTLGNIRAFEVSAASSASVAADAGGGGDRRGRGRSYISVADDGDEGGNIFRRVIWFVFGFVFVWSCG